jgi:hypothetical protein
VADRELRIRPHEHAVDLNAVPEELVQEFSLDDPSVLQEPNSHPERPIARRDVYNELWLEVKAAA